MRQQNTIDDKTDCYKKTPDTPADSGSEKFKGSSAEKKTRKSPVKQAAIKVEKMSKLSAGVEFDVGKKHGMKRERSADSVVGILLKALDPTGVKNKYAPELQVLFETQAEFENSGRTIKSSSRATGGESIDINAEFPLEDFAAIEIPSNAKRSINKPKKKTSSKNDAQRKRS